MLSLQKDQLFIEDQDQNQKFIEGLQQLTVQFQIRERQLQLENQKLKHKNNDLQSYVNVLENKQDEIVNEVQDLKALLRRTYQEGQLEVQNLRKRNEYLQCQNNSLTKALISMQDNLQEFSAAEDGRNLLQ